MALCEKFLNLSRLEQIEMVGKIVHAIQNDTTCFDVACDLLNHAERCGIFENVVINPPPMETIEEFTDF